MTLWSCSRAGHASQVKKVTEKILVFFIERKMCFIEEPLQEESFLFSQKYFY